jgi:replicative DNA helicase
MNDIMVFIRPDDINKNTIYLGLNNTFDATIRAARQELILIGGRRGAGKSLVCSNMQTNQYEAGFTSVYFTIEMVAIETLQRNISILANVNHQNVKNGTLTDAELLSVVKSRAGMYEESQYLVDEFVKTRDQYKFEETLVKQCSLRPKGQMIIVDDRALTIPKLDLHLGKVKAQFGDNFTVAVVDYLNQIVVTNGNQFDWQAQVEVSKALKELARKHDILIVSPYQISDDGQTRFAKGILDAPDIALILEAHTKEDNAISMETTKIRGAKEMKFTSGMNWDTLRISPQSIEKPAKVENDKDSTKHKKGKKEATGESAGEGLW